MTKDHPSRDHEYRFSHELYAKNWMQRARDELSTLHGNEKVRNPMEDAIAVLAAKITDKTTAEEALQISQAILNLRDASAVKD